MSTSPHDHDQLPADGEQRHAAELLRENPNVAVEAPPGTGKTFLAVYLAVCAARQGWIDPHRPALLLTFSRNARVQLEQEVSRYTACRWMSGSERRSIIATNYHAFFLEHLRARAGLWGCAKELRPASLAEARERVERCLERHHVKVTDEHAQAAALRLSRERFAPEELVSEPPQFDREIEASLMTAAAAGLRDGRPAYDDFAPLFLNLLEIVPEYADWLRAKHPLVVVDEFQDTDRVQYEVLLRIRPTRFVILYDRFQMIYGWRGSRPERPATACQDFAIDASSQAKLSTIHRTRDRRFLAEFFKELRIDGLWGRAVTGGPHPWLTLDPYEPRGGWARTVPQRRNAMLRAVALKLKEMASQGATVAALVRHNDTAVQLAQRISTRQDFPTGGYRPPFRCRLICGEAEAADERIRGLVRVLPDLDNSDSLLPWMGEALGALLPPDFKYMGRTHLGLQHEFSGGRVPFAARKRPELGRLADAWRSVCSAQGIGLWERLACGLRCVVETALALTSEYASLSADALHYLRVLIRCASAMPIGTGRIEGCERLEDALLQATYLRLRDPAHGLSVMTIHQSKGREFDHVVLPWLGIRDEEPLDIGRDEDRRLLYVALTRAREHVTLIWPTYMTPAVLRQWKLA